MFQLMSMCSYAKNNLQMCSVTQHQCRRRKIWGKFSKIHSEHTFCMLQKNDFSWLNNLFMAMFQLIRMSSYAKNKLQMCSVSQHKCRRREMRVKVSQTHPVHSLFVCYKKNDLSWLTNHFMVIFQLIRLSSYAKNKLKMSSVNHHQCRHRQMWGKLSQIHPVHSLFFCFKKWLVLTELSIKGQVSSH